MLKLNNFQKKLLNEFKSYVHDESLHLELDFRSHVFLDNQGGAYPTYDYSIAEIVIDCIFSFLEKHKVDHSGRYNKSMMIESLRTQKLNLFIVEVLTSEIEEDIFNVMKVKEPPSFEIENSFIDGDKDNPCLCIDIDEKTQDFICTRLDIDVEMNGSGISGFINIQYPISNDSQVYVAGGHWTDDINRYYDDDLICELVTDIIEEGKDSVSRRDYELEAILGTSYIEKHDNGILHSYYNGLDLALLENKRTKEAYVTFESITNEHPQYFPCYFYTFKNLQAAQDYIKHHCDNYQSLQDFNISHDIFNELENEYQ